MADDELTGIASALTVTAPGPGRARHVELADAAGLTKPSYSMHRKKDALANAMSTGSLRAQPALGELQMMETRTPVDLESVGAFLAAAGLRLTQAGGDRVEGRIELGPDQHTPWGIIHGGVYTTAIESAASIGANAAVAERGLIAVGINNNTDFLRSMTSGTVIVTAIPLQQSRTQQLWDVQIRDQQDRLVARGTVRLQNIEPRQSA